MSARTISTTFATGCETGCIKRKKNAESEKPMRIKGRARSPVALKIINEIKGIQERQIEIAENTRLATVVSKPRLVER